MTTTLTKERPILFTPAMAQAVYEGRKTQTRRTVKFGRHPEHTSHCPGVEWTRPGETAWINMADPVGGGTVVRPCPYGVPGDRLWVRESIRYQIDERPDVGLLDCIEYRDGTMRKPDGLDEDTGHWFDVKCENNREAQVWTPNIHIPRWACRSVLEVLSVRVERADTGGIDDDGKSYNRGDWLWVVEFKRIATGGSK